MEKEITLNDIAIRAKSKKEVYQVLTIEGGLYLPPMADANIKYIQNIMKGHNVLSCTPLQNKNFILNKNWLKIIKN